MSWFKGETIERIGRALKIGIDKTTSDAAIEAKRLVHRETTTLQGSIYPEPAIFKSDGTVEGRYGPHDVSYAAVQEFLPGEQMPDGSTRVRKGGKPYMRPSMKTATEKLPQNIINAYQGLS